jgi:hypothetical protein
MSFIAAALTGKQIDSVHVDTEVTYIMLTDGTQITIKGLVIVAPAQSPCRPATIIHKEDLRYPSTSI